MDLFYKTLRGDLISRLQTAVLNDSENISKDFENIRHFWRSL